MSSIDKRSFANTKVPPISYRRIPDFEHKLMLALLDAAVFLIVAMGSYVMARLLGADVQVFLTYWDEFLFMLVCWWISASLNDLYDPFVSRDQSSLVKNVLASSGMVFVLLVVVTMLPGYSASRGFHIALAAIALLAITMWRLKYASVSKAKLMVHRTLILGYGLRTESAVEFIHRWPKLQYQVCGFVGECSNTAVDSHDGPPIWSPDEDLSALVEQLVIDTIIVAPEYRMDDKAAYWLLECQSRGMQVYWLPEFFDKQCHRIPVDHVDPAWMITAMQQSSGKLKAASKVILDWALILVALPTLIVLLPLLALLVRLSSPGAIFYRQTRLGYAGQPFTIFKFRTMFEDAESGGKAQWAVNGDPRITPIGRFLRKSHLDELPQLFNILRGEMSLTGPRPERPEFVSELEKVIPYYRVRLLVKPGLTGWAQVKYDYGSSVEDAQIKLEYDCHYIRNWSVVFDIYIIFRTFFVSIGGKGT